MLLFKSKNNLLFFHAILLLLAFACILSCKSTSQIQPPLNGMIYDYDNMPVLNATITVTHKISKENSYTQKKNTEPSIKTDCCVTSDMYGHFRLEQLNDMTTYTIRIAKQEYETLSVDIEYKNISQVVYIQLYSAEQLLTIAENAIEETNYTKASEYLNRSKKISGNIKEIEYLRAVIFYKTNEYENAITILQNILTTDTNRPYVDLFLADIYQYKLHNLRMAKIYLTKYLETAYDESIEKRLSEL